MIAYSNSSVMAEEISLKTPKCSVGASMQRHDKMEQPMIAIPYVLVFRKFCPLSSHDTE